MEDYTCCFNKLNLYVADRIIGALMEVNRTPLAGNSPAIVTFEIMRSMGIPSCWAFGTKYFQITFLFEPLGDVRGQFLVSFRITLHEVKLE